MSTLVEQKHSGPRSNFVSIPCLIVVVCHYSITKTQRRNFPAYILQVLLLRQLGRMHSYNRQPLVRILFMPALYKRQCVATVVAGEGPKFDQHHSPTQALKS